MSNVGPDCLLPSVSLSTTEPDGAVKIQTSESFPDNYTPISVPTLMKNVTKVGKSHPALAVKREGKWVYWSYQEYLQVTK